MIEEDLVHKVIIETLAFLNKEFKAQSKKKFKQYTVQIWCNDDIAEECDFSTKKQSIRWAKEKLLMNKYKHVSYADIKKYDKDNECVDWWFYKYVNNRIEDVTDRGII